MKLLVAKAKTRALTLIELVVVICLIIFLVAMMLSMVVVSPKHRPYTIVCLNNQKQIAIAYLIWQNDHEGKLPWQLSATNGGTLESLKDGDAAQNFNSLSNFVRWGHVFICPTDKLKTAATNQAQLTDQNLSYFVSLNSDTNNHLGILTGDRNLRAGGNPVRPGLFVFTNGTPMDWTMELHDYKKSSPMGIMSFLDGHAEASRGTNLTLSFQHEGTMGGRLAVP